MLHSNSERENEMHENAKNIKMKSMFSLDENVLLCLK